MQRIQIDRRHWKAGISDGLTLPCSRCGEIPKFDYSVDDDFWRLIVTDRKERVGVICLPCLDKLAHERNLDLASHLLNIQFTGMGVTVLLKPEVACYYAETS